MRRKLMLAAASLASLLVGPIVGSTAAQAGIPIPCMATRFLKATDLNGITDESGQRATPYYNVFGCADGKWDGYRTADGKYMNLDSLPLTKLPPAPTFWTAAMQNPGRFWVEWMWIVIGFFVVLGTALAKVGEVSQSAGAGGPMQPPRARRS